MGWRVLKYGSVLVCGVHFGEEDYPVNVCLTADSSCPSSPHWVISYVGCKYFICLMQVMRARSREARARADLKLHFTRRARRMWVSGLRGGGGGDGRLKWAGVLRACRTWWGRGLEGMQDMVG